MSINKSLTNGQSLFEVVVAIALIAMIATTIDRLGRLLGLTP